jgi:replicative DNA helicase
MQKSKSSRPSEPGAADIERRLLACLMLDGAPSIVRCCGLGITPGSFGEFAHQLVFSAIVDLHAAGQQTDNQAVETRLAETRRLVEAGGREGIDAIFHTLPSALDVAFYAERVKTAEKLRRVAALAARIAEDAGNWAGDPLEEVFGPAIDALAGLLVDQRKNPEWGEVVASARALTETRMLAPEQRGADEAGLEVSWGFSDFDRCLQPMERGELVLLASRPSTGKSSLGRQAAFRAVAGGVPALVSLMEVTNDEFAVNLAANVSGVRSRKELYLLGDDEREALLGGFDTMAGMERFVVCDQDTTLAALLARAKAFKARFGLGLWVVDYLQLVEDTKIPLRGERIDQAIGRVTSALKKFAVNERVVVMLLCQLNRAIEREGNRVPRLSDLRDSGRIEEDANRVVFLHRPDEYMVGGERVAQYHTDGVDKQPFFYTNFIQAKGRNHGTGCVGMMFHRQTASFEQIAMGSHEAVTKKTRGRNMPYAD